MAGTQPVTAEDILRQSQIGSSSTAPRAGPSSFLAPDARDIFAGGLDPAALHPLAGINEGQLDYLLLDDDKLNALEGAKGVLPSRGWADELCYGTGTTYVSGLAAGALWGLREGLFRPIIREQAKTGFNLPSPGSTGTAPGAQDPFRTRIATPLGNAASKGAAAAGQAAAAARSPTFRLRLNNILNSVTRRGTFVGNQAGVLAVIYNACNSTIDSRRQKHDIYGAMAAGAITGAVFKSTAGLRNCAISSALFAGGAAVWTRAKPWLL